MGVLPKVKSVFMTAAGMAERRRKGGGVAGEESREESREESVAQQGPCGVRSPVAGS